METCLEEKLITVISIEDQEARLSYMNQQLVECYKPTIS